MVYFCLDPDVWFPMDEVRGNKLQGTVEGTVIGNAPLVPGQVEQAMSFDGRTQYVDYGYRNTACFSNPDMCDNGVTYSMWIMRLPHGSQSNVLGSGGWQPDSVGYALILKPSGQMILRAITVD